MNYKEVSITLHQESLHRFGKFTDRLVPLEDNPLVLPLPKSLATDTDPVATDLADIPRIVQNIQDDWNAPHGISLNRLTAWHLGRRLKKRFQAREAGRLTHNAVDVLVTGCEVSLWLGEQFAADLANVFKKLSVKCISSNKILGLLGQDFPIPQNGHQYSKEGWDLANTIVIIVSHSGGTFGSLNVANLVQSLTQSIFVVTSEWDTQIGKQLRQLDTPMFDSRIFTTNCGVRPAEPCSISVVATHELLTHIFKYMAQIILAEPKFRLAAGSILTDTDLSELERCTRDNIAALEEITGFDRDGNQLPPDRAHDSIQLRAKGAHMAQHVLETPRVWIMIAVYVVLSVTLGKSLVTGLVEAAELADVTGRVGYATRFIDSLIYLFLPQLCMLLLRAVQRRPLLHRMTGRSVVIGDCPWVAQSAEAYLSKLFACAYSATSIAVYSGNPSDHLVHRMTHRVVRGALLVCGRPDGRLTTLTTLENTVSLSVNQASSIQSLGYTCESLTIGHNPFHLPLTAHSVFLRGNRPNFLCERLLKSQMGIGEADAVSKGAGALLGEVSNDVPHKDWLL